MKPALIIAVACMVSLAASACSSYSDPYFGKATAPTEQRLVYNSNSEPESLDPQARRV